MLKVLELLDLFRKGWIGELNFELYEPISLVVRTSAG